MLRAACAAEKFTTGFNAMTDDFATAMFALWRQRVNGAFKAVEIMRNTVGHNFQGLVVIVPADFALHKDPFSNLFISF
jgi:hypothetical protein